MNKDYYAILGVPKNATPKQIKAAYMELARKHHPDMCKDKTQGEEKFKEISEAYEVLMDPPKRAMYDVRGSGSVRDMFFDGDFDWRHFTQIEDIDEFAHQVIDNFLQKFAKDGSIFDEFFVAAPEIPKAQRCKECDGAGQIHIKKNKLIAIIVKCKACGGTGRKK